MELAYKSLDFHALSTEVCFFSFVPKLVTLMADESMFGNCIVARYRTYSAERSIQTFTFEFA